MGLSMEGVGCERCSPQPLQRLWDRAPPARRIANKFAPTFVATWPCLAGHGCQRFARLKTCAKSGDHGV